MAKLLDFLDGKKTYLTALAAALIAGAQALGYSVPEWVFTMLAGFGIYAVRSAVAKAGS
jgi:hypothetical protein